jgi:L-alanine-DL-glutamate epimerase-like enolase superfamily enzyme
MRITGIRATPVAVPFRRDETWAYGRRRGLISVLVEVDTDDGVTGIGEAAAYPAAPIVEATLCSIEPLVLGEDPFTVERLLKRVDVVGTWHHMRAQSPALAAVECACWDIIGKVCGQPLVNLFGGRFHDAVEYFWYVSGDTADDLAAVTRQGVEEGYRTFYLKVGSPDPATDLERVAAVRVAAGASARIRVDANEAWSPGTAVRTIRDLAAYGIELVEQPTSGRNLAEMAYVRGRVDVPLLANEASWTRYDQLQVIRQDAADVISVDNQMDGGLLNLKRAAGLCEAAGLPVLKHSLGELGVAQTAGLHVLAATPNVLHASQGYGSLLSDDVLAEPLVYDHGRLTPPYGPGLGVTLDRDKVARYAELYATAAAGFAFHDPRALAPSPALPRC